MFRRQNRHERKGKSQSRYPRIDTRVRSKYNILKTRRCCVHPATNRSAKLPGNSTRLSHKPCAIQFHTLTALFCLYPCFGSPFIYILSSSTVDIERLGWRPQPLFCLVAPGRSPATKINKRQSVSQIRSRSDRDGDRFFFSFFSFFFLFFLFLHSPF